MLRCKSSICGMDFYQNMKPDFSGKRLLMVLLLIFIVTKQSLLLRSMVLNTVLLLEKQKTNFARVFLKVTGLKLSDLQIAKLMKTLMLCVGILILW